MSTPILINDVISNYYFLIGGSLISYLIYRIIHSLLSGNYYRQTRYKTRGHTWRSIECNKSIPFNNYCTVCGKLMLPLVGLFCECCGASACKQCRRAIDKKFKCKQISWPQEKTFYHHWVQIGSVRGDIADHLDDGPKKFYCSWCQRTKVCQDSAYNGSEQCDFQKYKNIIIPPSSVVMENGVVVGINPPQIENWEPLIVFANRKSGSNQSAEVLSLLRGLLNPLQVVDLSETPPESVVRWLPPRCRVLAAGGDGTAAWVAGAIAAQPHLRAPVAILPMGTGNDLSRALGWGARRASPLYAHQIIQEVTTATEEIIDRWKITITPRRGRLGRARPVRTLYAYNYASVGVDAQVALDFHRARTQFLYRYASRYINYLAYLVLGAGRVLDGGCAGLERRLRVRLDGGGECPLPPLQALVLLNIPSWGAGVDLWSLGCEEDVGPQSMNDGKLEVVGISSSFHIARLQCGLAQPYRFAQASTVHVELSGACAMQVDGEPWMQGAADITAELGGQCLMLRAQDAH